MNDCEFCDELKGAPSRFHGIYAPEHASRIVATSERFVAMPTLGQLFPGSLLVVPRLHVETLAEASSASWTEDLTRFVDRLRPVAAEFGHPFLWEHGARRTTGSGCGIYHAHLHLVPVPSPVTYELLLPRSARTADSLSMAFGELAASANYLVCVDTDGRVAFDLRNAERESFSSQYARRKLTAHCGLASNWDWRTYDRREPFLLNALRSYRSADVPQRA